MRSPTPTRTRISGLSLGLGTALLALACQQPASKISPPTSQNDQAVDAFGQKAAALSAAAPGLSFEMTVGEATVQLSLRATTPATAAGYKNYGVDAQGRLVARPVLTPSCHYQGSAVTTQPDGTVSTGLVSVSSCSAATGYPTGQAATGVLVMGKRLWDLRPVPADSDLSDGVLHTLSPAQRAGSTEGSPSSSGDKLTHTIELRPSALSPNPVSEFREGTALETKYIELVLVNDAARVAQRGAQVEADGLALIQAANAMLDDSNLSPRVRIVLAAQVSFENDPFPLFSGDRDANGQPVPLLPGQEVDHALQLDSFLDWALNNDELPRHDEHLLLSGQDFLANSAGLAPVAAACLVGQNGFLVQADASDPTSGIGFSVLSTVHELGHTLGMDHDPNTAACPNLEGIMSAVGCANCPLGGIEFSPCSQANFTNYLASYDYLITSCADDLPSAPGFAFCGDGVVSEGETCDCGSDDCRQLDPCCNGATCQLQAGATCSDYNDECCAGCEIIPADADVLCRAQRSECDTEERCTGASPQCPSDSFLPAGGECLDSDNNQGVCYFGNCRSRTPQCEQIGVLLAQQNPGFSSELTAPDETCEQTCGSVVCTGDLGNGPGCIVVNGTAVTEGVTCDVGEGGQCVSGECVALVDQCPEDALKTAPGICGCGEIDQDLDFDGALDCQDACPEDGNKQELGACGCGIADTDFDQDGSADCVDACPEDPNKQEVGVCGCGTSDSDEDSDGTPDCADECPTFAAKIAPGQCGCDTPDTDGDGDGVANCLDACPEDGTTTSLPCPAETEQEDPDSQVAVRVTTSSGICSVSAPANTPSKGSFAWLGLAGGLLLLRRRHSVAPRTKQ